MSIPDGAEYWWDVSGYGSCYESRGGGNKTCSICGEVFSGVSARRDHRFKVHGWVMGRRPPPSESDMVKMRAKKEAGWVQVSRRKRQLQGPDGAILEFTPGEFDAWDRLKKEAPEMAEQLGLQQTPPRKETTST